MNARLISWLMRLYPQAWRKEYGAELTAMLQARQLTAKICSDVVRSAIWQRLRAIQTPTWVGIGLMMVTIGAIASIVVNPPPYPVQPSWELSRFMDPIELLQRPLRSEFYVLVLAGIGFWTAARDGQQSGRVAIRVSTIASLPLVVLGVLMLSGALECAEIVPGQTSTTLAEHGILYTYTFYKGLQQIPGPAPLVMVLSPLLRLPGAWMWGTIGGSLGRKYANWRRRPVSA